MSSERSTVVIPSIGNPTGCTTIPEPCPGHESHDSSAANSSAEAGAMNPPKLNSKKSNSTMIVSREAASIEVEHEHNDGDVRSMSLRRSSEELEKLGDDVRKDLVEQAKTLQASLLAIVDRVEAVKEEHEKLEGGNKFLQSYIGELMQISKITSSAPPKSKGKARSAK